MSMLGMTEKTLPLCMRLSGRGVHLSLKWVFLLLDSLGWGTQLEVFLSKPVERDHAA